MAYRSGRSSRSGKGKGSVVSEGKSDVVGLLKSKGIVARSSEGEGGLHRYPKGMSKVLGVFDPGKIKVLGAFDEGTRSVFFDEGKSSVYRVLEVKNGTLTIFEGESGTVRVVEDKSGKVRSVEVEAAGIDESGEAAGGQVAVSERIEAAERDARVEPPGQRVRRLRSRRDLLELDIRRELKQYRREGLSEREIAAVVEVSQPTVHKMLQVAAKDSDPLEGFKGATPLEICQRYEAGEFEREELVDQLVLFPYVEGGATDGYDWMAVDPPGSWSELSIAIERGLIDESVYEDVFNRLHVL